VVEPCDWKAVAGLIGFAALPVNENVWTIGGFSVRVVQELVISGVK